ncbi:histone-lysine N-methyltransferase Suv4-20 isoform X1 [Drosophila sulfurigaster albostrigata]|uniref:histone-lysine N-methyltransferase Suv4-20 isoform X1 n=1 Tax=Drosophila sulfurigaster albostrigata TaxID=89887 RepID=UPI002D21CA63|nr:histone-lysine N-methyltransferase Suv4-20 isoform X1 [Drosophila sulfurigaster albostrigata]
MPSRRSGGVGTTRRKHSLGNLRRAHPASGATWNVQVVRGKMSSKCLWHACRALILGLTLMLVGAGMATLGYYADHLSMGSELRGNVTVRVKNDLKGFHLNNFSYVGPIVMGFGGFIVVASCVMTFEARDSAAKVVPARLRAGGGSCNKSTARSNQGSSASQRRGMGAQYQSTRWDQHFGVFRSSPGDAHQQLQASGAAGDQLQPHQQQQQPFDREALTAELIKFSKSLSASTRFSPQLRRLTFTGSVPNLSTIHHHANAHPSNACIDTNPSVNLFSPHYHHKTPLEQLQLQLQLQLQQQQLQMCCKRHHHHHRHHQHQHQHKQRKQQQHSSSSVRRVRTTRSAGGGGGGGGCGGAAGGAVGSSSRIISNSSSLIQRNTREYATCTLLQPPAASRVYWQASSFDAGMGGVVGVAHSSAGSEKRAERNKRSDTAKRHVLSRQRPIEHEEAARERERCSPLGHRRNSTMSDSSYSGRWTARCASVASRTSSIDSRQVRVDLHSPEVMPKSILRSPKRYSCGPSATPSVEKDFRSQLSVCSEPPPPVRQLSGQSSMEPAVPEESVELIDERHSHDNDECHVSSYSEITELAHHSSSLPPKKQRPDFLPLGSSADHQQQQQQQQQQSSDTQKVNPATLYRSNSSRQFYRPKPGIANERDDSVFYIRSLERHASSTSGDDHMYDSLRVINERRSTLLKADSQSSLGSAERKLSSFSLKMPDITERENSIDIEDPPKTEAETLPKATTDEEKPQEET